MSVRDKDEPAKAKRLSDESRRDIELVLLGAVLVSASPDDVFKKLPLGHLSADMQKLFKAVQDSKKFKAIDPLITGWLSQRAIVLEKGDDLLTAIVRRFVAEAEMRMISSHAFAVTHAMKNGEPSDVIQLLKTILSELGELPDGAKKNE